MTTLSRSAILLPGQFGVTDRGPAEQVHRADPADDLLSCRARQRRVGDQPPPLVRVVEEGEHPAGRRGAGGLVSRDRQQDEEQLEPGGGQYVPGVVGLEQLGDDVVGRQVPAALG
jgi:hypothetical protein